MEHRRWDWAIIEFNQVAFRYGITLEDELENKYIIVGFDQTGVLLEILYN